MLNLTENGMFIADWIILCLALFVASLYFIVNYAKSIRLHPVGISCPMPERIRKSFSSLFFWPWLLPSVSLSSIAYREASTRTRPRSDTKPGRSSTMASTGKEMSFPSI